MIGAFQKGPFQPDFQQQTTPAVVVPFVQRVELSGGGAALTGRALMIHQKMKRRRKTEGELTALLPIIISLINR